MSDHPSSFITVEARTELRAEFLAAMLAQKELLITGGVARHEKAMLRMDALEVSAKTFEANLNRVPTQLDRETARLTELFNEKLSRVGSRIDAFHEHTDAMRQASKDLTDSYNRSNDVAIAKSDAATNREIEGIKTLIDSKSKDSETQVKNLEGRLNRGEGLLMGGKGALGIGISVAGVLVAASVFLHSQPAVDSSSARRVDDIAALTSERSRENGQRLDALTARINQLTLPLQTAPQAPR